MLSSGRLPVSVTKWQRYIVNWVGALEWQDVGWNGWKHSGEQAPEQTEIQQLDVTEVEAVDKLHLLIDKLGGMDLFLLSTGVGNQNRTLNPDIELATVNTNAIGFTRMVTAAYHYFKEQGCGHLAVISSIAGTKGLGVAPSIPPPNVSRILISTHWHS